MIEKYVATYVTSIVENIEAMFGVEYQIPLDEEGQLQYQESDALSSDPKFWVNIGFHGTISGDYFLAVDPKDWTEILADMVGNEEEFEEMLPSCLNELLNITCGKAIEALHEDFPELTISSPRYFDGKLGYPETKIFTCILEHEQFHPMEASFCLNLMKQNISYQLEAEIKRASLEAAKARKAENTIAMIMENLDQGVCILDQSGIISPGVSKQMGDLFFAPLVEIEAQKFIDACPFEIIGNQKQEFINWLALFHAMPNSMDMEDLLDMSPLGREITFIRENKNYTYAFNFIKLEEGDKELMIFLNDVTKEKELIAEIESEQARLTVITKVAQDRDGFIQFLTELERLIVSIYAICAHRPVDIDIDELFRGYHIIKRTAANCGLKKVVEQTQIIESELEEIRSGQVPMTDGFVLHLMTETLNLQKVFHQILEEDLGSILTKEDREQVEKTYKITQSKMLHLKNLLLDRVTEDLQDFIQEAFETLIEQPIGQIFIKYAEAAKSLAENLNKKIHVKIQGKHVEVSFEYLKPLFDVLVHLVHNCVDHGLESSEIRNMLGKPETGTLRLEADKKNRSLILRISDDGGGIDAERIKTVALTKGIIDESFAALASEDELIELIFAPGFSTHKNVSNVPGSGRGMDAVKAAVDQLKGRIDIQTALDKGTTFEITIPHGEFK